MLNQNDCSLDLSTGSIDENPQIRVKPSIQATIINTLKEIERKRSQDPCPKDPKSQLKYMPRKNQSTGKIVKTKTLFENKNDQSKKISEEKTRKVYNFRDKMVKNSFSRQQDDEKFQASTKIIKEKRSIQSFMKQLQHNCNEIKEKVKPGPGLIKKNSFDNRDLKKFINKRLSKSPVCKKNSPIKQTPVKTPNFSFQPLKPASATTDRILKRPEANKSPQSSDSKVFASPKSEQILIKKFESEFIKIVNDLDFDSSGLLNYSKFCQVLQKMNFISSNLEKTDEERELLLKAWKILGGNDSTKISKKNLCNFLMAVSNLLKKIRASSNDTAISGMKNGTLFLSVDDVKRIHKDFQSLYLNRKSPKLQNESSSKTPLKLTNRLIFEEKKEEAPSPMHEVPDLLAQPKALIFQTTPSKDLQTDDFDQSIKFNFKPTLSIPKVAPQKSTSLRSINCSPENFLQRVKFTYHSISPDPQKKSVNYSIHTSESEHTENSCINPLVTPPSYASKEKILKFCEGFQTDRVIKEGIEKGAKRYKCQSPESYEESEESILVTVVLPDEQEEFIRIHKEDDLNSVIKDFGRRHKLEVDQLITLKQEILQKLK